MKKKTIIIMVIVLLVVVVVGLYGTYAASGTDDTYNVTLNNSLEEITIPSGSSKTIIYHITNTNNGIVQYGVVYSGSNITVKIYDNSENSATGTFDYGENKYIKLYITNSGTSDSTATIKTVLGYENGGDLIIPSGYTLVSEVYTKLTTFITNLYTNAEKSTVTNNSITYNTAPSVGLMNDRLGSSSTDIDGGNIRYYGASPSNYMYFNCSDYSNQTSDTCETWRIIGVFEGKVKIMRNSIIGSLAWDQDKNINSSVTTHDNDWSTASLQVLLNQKYYNGDTAGTVTYYSGSSGSTSTNLNMSSIGIKNDTTRNLISDTLYYLGGWDDNRIYSDTIYEKERGTTVYSGRPTTWTGKIALPYPSDYGYAADLGSCTVQLVSYDNSTCTSTNWMKSILGTGSHGRLLTHYLAGSSVVWVVGSSGLVSYGNTPSAFGVAPVLYLSSELGIESGTGTNSDPYRLSVS